jgi:hypothetical protein
MSTARRWRRETGRDLFMRAADAFTAAGERGIEMLKDAGVELITLEPKARATFGRDEGAARRLPARRGAEGEAAGFDGPPSSRALPRPAETVADPATKSPARVAGARPGGPASGARRRARRCRLDPAHGERRAPANLPQPACGRRRRHDAGDPRSSSRSPCRSASWPAAKLRGPAPRQQVQRCWSCRSSASSSDAASSTPTSAGSAVTRSRCCFSSTSS